MPQTKIQGKFYPLQHEEFLNLNQRLTQSELAVYLWLKTNDPFGERLVEADTKEIAKDLNVSRRTIQRALVKLREEKLIDLVITKFHYRIRSKSTSDNNNTNKVKERLRVATQMSPGDTDVAEAISMSPKCHPCRQSDPHVAEVTPMSRSSPETTSEQAFQNPKTIQTYSDFKKTLSESERENFLKFVEKKIHNLEKPINDLEAWLASQTKAKQNRWEVYYQSYQEEGRKITRKNSKSNSKSRKEKKLAIENWQEHLKQQEEIYKDQEDRAKKDLELKSGAKRESKTTTDSSTKIPDPWAEVQLSDDIDIIYPDNDLDGYINSADNELDSAHSDCHSTDGEVNSADNSGGESLSQESEEDLKQQIDRILNGFSRVEDIPNTSPEKPDPNLSQKVNEGLQYLRGMEVTKYESEENERPCAVRRRKGTREENEMGGEE